MSQKSELRLLAQAFGRRLALLACLIVATVVLFCLSVWVASTRDTTALENTLLQFLGIFFGALFSWLIGDALGKEATKREMTARAQLAFRRVVRLYEAQSRVAEQADRLTETLIERSNNGQVNIKFVVDAFNTLQVQVREQIGTANDAMDDWRDLAPAEVAELEARARQREKQRQNDDGDQREQ